MEKIVMAGTKKTPTVIFDPIKGLLDIRGYSIPEDPARFYKPIESVIHEYLQDPPEKTTINIFLKYFNTGTSKWLWFILMQFKQSNKDGDAVTVNWYYEKDDDDALEAGNGYSTLLQFPFNIIEYKEGKEQ